jgi:hypothetical protein
MKRYAIWKEPLYVSLGHKGFILKGGGTTLNVHNEYVKTFDSIEAAKSWIELYKGILNVRENTYTVEEYNVSKI